MEFGPLGQADYTMTPRKLMAALKCLPEHQQDLPILYFDDARHMEINPSNPLEMIYIDLNGYEVELREYNLMTKSAQANCRRILRFVEAV